MHQRTKHANEKKMTKVHTEDAKNKQHHWTSVLAYKLMTQNLCPLFYFLSKSSLEMRTHFLGSRDFQNWEKFNSSVLVLRGLSRALQNWRENKFWRKSLNGSKMTAQEGNVGEETLSCPTDSSTGCSRPKMLTQILFEVLNVVHDFVDRMYYRKACTTFSQKCKSRWIFLVIHGYIKCICVFDCKRVIKTSFSHMSYVVTCSFACKW